MKRKALQTLGLLILLIVFAVDLFSIPLKLYWSIWWLDLLLHVLAGLGVGMLAAAFLVVRGMAFFRVLSSLFISTLVFAAIWEGAEAITGGFFAREYVIDTATDSILVIAGGLSAVFLLPRSLFKKPMTESNE